MFITACLGATSKLNDVIVIRIRLAGLWILTRAPLMIIMAQGTLLVTLRNSNSPMDENEVRRKFQQFGDVKQIRFVPGRPE
jgi:hypothetical protein